MPGQKQLSESPKDVRAREAQVMEMLHAGVGMDEIAERLNYADHSAIVRIRDRVVRRHIAADLEALRAMEVERTDALLETLWPLASKGNLQAIDRVLRVMERRSRYLGLDHADGVAERAVRVEEAKFEVMVTLLEAALKEAQLTPEQATAIKASIAQGVMKELGPAE